MYENDDYSSSGEGQYRSNRKKFGYNDYEDYEGYFHEGKEGAGNDGQRFSEPRYNYSSSNSHKKRKYSSNSSMINISKCELSSLLDEKLSPITQRLTSLEHVHVKRLTKLESKVKALEQENKTLKDKINTIDSFSRRNNLRFYGVNETPKENCEEKILQLVSPLLPELNDRSFERIHRIGPKTKTGCRPIVAKVFHFKDKLQILKKRMQLKDLKIDVSDDYCKEVEVNRKVLLPYAKEAHNNGFNSRLIGDKLFINGERFDKDNLHKLPDTLKPESIYTQSKNNITAFFSKASPLSNFHPSQFVFENQVYNCGEQFLAVAKAKLFNDPLSEKEILKLKDPLEQKRRGYKIKNYRHEQWLNNCRDTTYHGLYQKFSQNPLLKEILLKTGSNLIVEASSDPNWGCGLKLNNPLIWDHKNHSGKNMLGTTLMKIRDDLK